MLNSARLPTKPITKEVIIALCWTFMLVFLINWYVYGYRLVVPGFRVDEKSLAS